MSLPSTIGMPDSDEGVMERSICRCGAHYQAWCISIMGIAIRTPPRCEDCTSREAEKRLTEEEEKAARLHERLCAERTALSESAIPERYRMSDATHPGFNARLWAGIGSWQPTKARPWLGLIGKTGECKTRCVTLLLEDVIRKGICRRPSFLTSYQLTWAVQNQFSENKRDAKTARGQLTGARDSDWLVLDDLGKTRHTPAVAAALFSLLDDRHARNAVTLWTANSTPGEFTRDMAEDIASPICGRLLECSEVFKLG